MGFLKTTTPVLLFTSALLLLNIQVNCDNGLVRDMRAECTNDGIKVHLEFRKPFYGVAYSHGHYETERCRYIGQDSPVAGSTNYRPGLCMELSPFPDFQALLASKGCGTVQHGTAFSEQINRRSRRKASAQSLLGSVTPAGGLDAYSEWIQYKRTGSVSSLSTTTPTSISSRSSSGSSSSGSGNGNEIYIENTLLIQHDPSIQEAGDLAQTLRCVWHKEIHRPLVASLPFHTRPRIKTDGTSFQAPQYQHRFTSSSSHTGGMTRMEHKGQVESVPHYPDLRKKWARSLKEPTSVSVKSSRIHDDDSHDNHNGPLALPLKMANTASSTSSSVGIAVVITAVTLLLTCVPTS